MQMHLKLSDVKEVHLCNTAIVWLGIILWDVCEKHKKWCIPVYRSGVKRKTDCFYSLKTARLTHGGEELGHPVRIALLACCEDPEQPFQTQMGQAGTLLLLPCILHDTGYVGVPPHQHTGMTIIRWFLYSFLWSKKTKRVNSLPKCCYLGQGIPTLSCHRGSGKFCPCSVHLGHLCVQFPPAAGSSVQPHLLHNAQILHLTEALREPPPCTECCLCQKIKIKNNNNVTQ